MKKKLCPQCKIAALYVKNEKGERRLIYVTAEGEVVPKYPDESLDGFDISEVLFRLFLAWFSTAVSEKLMILYRIVAMKIIRRIDNERVEDKTNLCSS